MPNRRHINGYTTVYRPKDSDSFRSGHNAGYKYEQRVVAELQLHRPLTRKDVVHHLNGVKSDNRPENLLVLSNSEHTRLHAYIRRNPEIYGLSRGHQLELARTQSGESYRRTAKPLETSSYIQIRFIDRPICSVCGKPCSKHATLCHACKIEQTYDRITPEFLSTVTREAQNSSVSSVARRLGVSGATVAKIISGDSKFIKKGRTLLDTDPAPPMPHPKHLPETTRSRLSESLKTYWKDRPSPCDKPVVKMTADGEVLEEYRSARDAQRKTGISNAIINRCCKSGRYTHQGYAWRYKPQ